MNDIYLSHSKSSFHLQKGICKHMIKSPLQKNLIRTEFGSCYFYYAGTTSKYQYCTVLNQFLRFCLKKLIHMTKISLYLMCIFLIMCLSLLKGEPKQGRQKALLNSPKLHNQKFVHLLTGVRRDVRKNSRLELLQKQGRNVHSFCVTVYTFKHMNISQL